MIGENSILSAMLTTTAAVAVRWVNAGASCRRCSSAIKMARASFTVAPIPKASCAPSRDLLGFQSIAVDDRIQQGRAGFACHAHPLSRSMAPDCAFSLLGSPGSWAVIWPNGC